MKRVRHRSKLYKRRAYKRKMAEKRRKEWEKWLGII